MMIVKTYVKTEKKYQFYVESFYFFNVKFPQIEFSFFMHQDVPRIYFVPIIFYLFSSKQIHLFRVYVFLSFDDRI